MSTMTQNINTLTQNMSTMMHNHNTLIEVLQKLMPKTDQVNTPEMLEASVHISTREALAKNQEELQKEININNATLMQEIETKALLDMEARLNNKIDGIGKIVENEKDKNHCQQRSIRQKEINVVLTKCTHQRQK